MLLFLVSAVCVTVLWFGVAYRLMRRGQWVRFYAWWFLHLLVLRWLLALLAVRV